MACTCNTEDEEMHVLCGECILKQPCMNADVEVIDLTSDEDSDMTDEEVIDLTSDNTNVIDLTSDNTNVIDLTSDN